MYCMIKTCMEDNGISSLVNIWKPGIKGRFEEWGFQLQQGTERPQVTQAKPPDIHQSSQPEQTLPSKMGETYSASHCSEALPMCQFQETRHVLFHRRLKLTDKLKPFSRQFGFTFLSPRHSCDQGLHRRQEPALFPVLILQRNYWVRKCLWTDAAWRQLSPL